MCAVTAFKGVQTSTLKVDREDPSEAARTTAAVTKAASCAVTKVQ